MSSCTEATRCAPEGENAPAHDAFTHLLPRQPPQHGGVGTGGEGLCGSLVLDDTTVEDLLSPISPALQTAPLPPSHSPLGKAKQMTGHFRLSSTRITREARSVRAFNGPGQNPLPDRFYSNLQIPSSLSRKATHRDTHQGSAIPRVQNGTPGCEQPPR
jgi:hypothetical protein